MTAPPPVRPIKPGNINLATRPAVPFRGGFATIRSISIPVSDAQPNGPQVLIPTVVGGHVVSDRQAVQHYLRTGKNLGTFRSVRDATLYAQWLHMQEAERIARTQR